MYSSMSCPFYRIRAKQVIYQSINCKYHSIIDNSFGIKSNNNNNNNNINNKYKKLNNNNLVLCNVTPFRHIFGIPLRPPNLSSSKTKKYRERRVLGYSKEQLFEVVSRVEDYHLFIPACVKSRVISRQKNLICADLEIGIPPLIWEKYSSRVTLVRPTLVSAQCIDGKLFKHLETQWKFSEGVPNNENSCTLDFSLSFEFKSLLHSQLVHVFFDEMARQTVNAFLKRAEALYGKQSFLINNQLPNKT